jgi:hypothetical protein
VVELWRVLAGTAPGRRDEREVTVFDSVGFALEDHATLRYVLAQAERHGLGTTIALVPATDDPKDLFRHARAGAATDAGSADVERGGVQGRVAVVDVAEVDREAGAPPHGRAHVDAGVEHL